MTHDRYPSAEYLLGAMVEDRVPRELALRIVDAYAEARNSLTDEQMIRWFSAMTEGLGRERTSTLMAVLAYPSEHLAPRYAELARSYDTKEVEHAKNA